MPLLSQKAVDDYLGEQWGEKQCKYSIFFKLETVDEPIDSTEMSPDHWFEIGQRIQVFNLKEHQGSMYHIYLSGTHTYVSEFEIRGTFS